MKKLIFPVYFILLLFISWMASREMLPNWDMIPYMGCVREWENPDSAAVQKQVYAEVRAHFSTEDWTELIQKSDDSLFRRKVKEDAHLFQAQLPFYKVKPGYLLLIYIAWKSGVNLPFATIVPSLLAYFLIGLLLFHWMSLYQSKIFSFTLSLLVMISGPLLEVARSSTPDASSSLFLLSSVFLLTEKKSSTYSRLLLWISILIRPDNLMFLFFTEACRILQPDLFCYSSRWKSLISIIFGGLIYFIVAKTVSAYNWVIFFKHSFISHSAFPSSFNSVFPFHEYLKELIHGIRLSQYSSISIFLVFSLPFIISVTSAYAPFKRKMAWILIASMAAHFFIFPSIEDRFFISHYLILVIFLFSEMKTENLTAIIKKENQSGI